MTIRLSRTSMCWIKSLNKIVSFPAESGDGKTLPIQNDDAAAQVQLQSTIIQQQNGTVKIQDLKEEEVKEKSDEDEQGK